MLLLTHSDLLARVPLFSNLDKVALEVMVKNVVKRSYGKGKLIVEKGNTSNALYVIVFGKASVVANDLRGKELILAELGTGDYVGEMSLIDGKPHSEDVVAVEKTDVLIVKRTEFMTCMAGNNCVALAMMQLLVDRLRDADAKIESLAFMNVYARVALVLRSMATTQANGARVVLGKISKQNIGKMIGASREMVTKVFKELEKRGAITHAQQATGDVLVLQSGIEALL